MARTGKAAVFLGPGQPFELRELPVPELEPGAILIRVSLANVCGSDLHFWRGDAPLALPAGRLDLRPRDDRARRRARAGREDRLARAAPP